jgi:hypothetical protein
MSVFPGFSTDGTCEALWFLFLSVWFLFLSVSASRCLPVVLAFWSPLVSDRLSGVTIIFIIIKGWCNVTGDVGCRRGRNDEQAS